jgi:hypothetical protein
MPVLIIIRIKPSNSIKNMQPPDPGLYVQWATSSDNNINSLVDEKAKDKTDSGLFVVISNKPFLDADIPSIQDGALVICAQNIATFLRSQCALQKAPSCIRN